MSDADANRTVLVRYPSTYVPAVPFETIKQVYGERTPDPRVEHVELIFEYWAINSRSPWLLYREIMPYLQGSIDSNNIYDFIRLLALRGFAEKFFNLTRTTVDDDSQLRNFLASNDVAIDTIRYYASWNGIDPELFVHGFIAGIAESATTVVTDLAQLARFMFKLQQAQLKDLELLVTDPYAGLQTVYEQAAMVGQLFDALVEQLDPTHIPLAIVNQWKNWNREFEKHLDDLDPFAAGKLLGRIAGDLWQLLTGIVAFVKLLRLAGRAVLKYAPLLIQSVRRVAAQAQVVIADLAMLLTAVGKKVLDGLAVVGFGILRTLFPPEVLRKLFTEGRAFITHLGTCLFPVFNEPYSLAFAGANMPRRFGVVISQEGRPMMMAAMSERLPAAGRAATSEEAKSAIDEILNQFDKLFREPGGTPSKMPLERAAVKAAADAMLEQRLDTNIRETLQKTAYKTFAELRRSRRKFYANELGRLIHKFMKELVAEEIVRAASAARATPAWFRTEKTLSSISSELLKADASTSKQALERAKNVLEERLSKMLARHPDVLDILGVEKTPAARSEKSIEKLLRERFGWTSETKVGSLQSDLTIADIDAKRLINVDYTSSTLLDRFEKVWGKIVDDLGGKFNGDWDGLAEAYRKAGKTDIPAEVKSGLEELTWHAVRETVIRKVALEEIFGPLWNVSSHEIIYDGLRKLFAMEDVMTVAPAGWVPHR